MTEPDPWDDYADGWDDDPAARAYAAAVHTSLSEALGRHALGVGGARICDFGCGTGLLTERLAGDAAHIDAVDTSPAMRAVLAHKIETRGFDTVRVHASVPDDQVYDLVVCSSVLSFVPDLDRTVAELAALLRPGGLLVHWDWEAADDDADGHGLERGAVRSALAGAGLTDLDVSTAFTIEMDGEAMTPIRGVGRRA